MNLLNQNNEMITKTEEEIEDKRGETLEERKTLHAKM